MTHTEKVHVMFGALTAVMGAMAWWSYRKPQSWTRRGWPILAFLLGFFMFIPVERQTRTYAEVGWWATFLSAFPGNRAELSEFATAWVARLAHFHVLQHKIVGVLGMAAGAVEFARARGALSAARWRWVLPIALIGVGLAAGLHGGTAEHLPHRVEQVQHRIFGAGLVIGGVLLALAESGSLRAVSWRPAWAVLAVVIGLDLMLFYRLH